MLDTVFSRLLCDTMYNTNYIWSLWWLWKFPSFGRQRPVHDGTLNIQGKTLSVPQVVERHRALSAKHGLLTQTSQTVLPNINYSIVKLQLFRTHHHLLYTGPTLAAVGVIGVRQYYVQMGLHVPLCPMKTLLTCTTNKHDTLTDADWLEVDIIVRHCHVAANTSFVKL